RRRADAERLRDLTTRDALALAYLHRRDGELVGGFRAGELELSAPCEQDAQPLRVPIRETCAPAHESPHANAHSAAQPCDPSHGQAEKKGGARARRGPGNGGSSSVSSSGLSGRKRRRIELRASPPVATT